MPTSPTPSGLPAPAGFSEPTLASAADKARSGCVAAEPIARRRGPTLEQAIFDAVLQQVNTVGFFGLTMEGVAACAHTGKAALYRRWTCKEDLVVDALNHVLPSFDRPPDTGNVRDDIAAIFRAMLQMINSTAGCAILGLIGELDRTHHFVKTLEARVLAPRKAMMIEVLERAVARGEIAADAVNPFVAEAGPALIVHQLFCAGPPVEESYAENVLDFVVMPLLRATPVKPVKTSVKPVKTSAGPARTPVTRART